MLASTTTCPRPSTATPAASSPSPSVLPARPVAIRTFSGRSTPPSGRVTASPRSSRATAGRPLSRCSRMPARSNASASSRDSSASSIGARGPPPTIVTSTPRALKIEAYSQPTMPLPTTARRRNGRSTVRICSESYTSGSSNGIPGGWKGWDPLAIRTTSPARTRSRPSGTRTTTVRSGASAARPRTSSMPCRSRLRSTVAVIVSTTSAVRLRRCSRVASGSRWRLTPYTSRRRKPVMYSAVSRSVLVGTPAVLTAAPPGRGACSTTATRLPK